MPVIEANLADRAAGEVDVDRARLRRNEFVRDGAKIYDDVRLVGLEERGKRSVELLSARRVDAFEAEADRYGFERVRLGREEAAVEPLVGTKHRRTAPRGSRGDFDDGELYRRSRLNVEQELTHPSRYDL